MTSLRRRATTLSIAGACALVLACLDPTEVVVHVTTDTLVLCARLAVVDFAVGGGQVASKTSPACTAKEVGTLNFVPSRSADERFALRVTGRMKLGADTVTATRVVGFLSHSKLGLGLVLEESCVNVTCKDGETCLHGACVPAQIGCDKDRTCTLDASAMDATDAACSVLAPTDDTRTLRAAWHFDEPEKSATVTSTNGDTSTVTLPAAVVADAPAKCGNSLGIAEPGQVALLSSFQSPTGVRVSFSVKKLADAEVALLVQYPAVGTQFAWKLVVKADATLELVVANVAPYSPANLKVPADMAWHRVELAWDGTPTLAVDGSSAPGPATMPYPGAGGAFVVGSVSGTGSCRLDELYLFSK